MIIAAWSIDWMFRFLGLTARTTRICNNCAAIVNPIYPKRKYRVAQGLGHIPFEVSSPTMPEMEDKSKLIGGCLQVKKFQIDDNICDHWKESIPEKKEYGEIPIKGCSPLIQFSGSKTTSNSSWKRVAWNKKWNTLSLRMEYVCCCESDESARGMNDNKNIACQKIWSDSFDAGLERYVTEMCPNDPWKIERIIIHNNRRGSRTYPYYESRTDQRVGAELLMKSRGSSDDECDNKWDDEMAQRSLEDDGSVKKTECLHLWGQHLCAWKWEKRLTIWAMALQNPIDTKLRLMTRLFISGRNPPDFQRHHNSGRAKTGSIINDAAIFVTYAAWRNSWTVNVRNIHCPTEVMIRAIASPIGRQRDRQSIIACAIFNTISSV